MIYDTAALTWPHAKGECIMDIRIGGAPGARISEKLYGIFFEDINYGGDGGLYAELVPNRAFECAGPQSGNDRMSRWSAVNGACIAIDALNPRGVKNPHYLRVTPNGSTGGVRSEGYLGEGFFVEAGEGYRLSVIFRAESAIYASIVAQDGAVLCRERIETAQGWEKRDIMLNPSQGGVRGYLEISSGQEFCLDFVSLFPEHTFKMRRNGMRSDLAQALADLHPAFMRFPGGCIVEGRSFDSMYRWKETIGPLEERRVNWNRWQLDEYQIDGRSSRDYYQSYGLGFFEYMQFCEDIGCLALPILNCGLTCQWHEALALPLDEMDGIVSDYLDFIEFCNGAPDSFWGAKRAEMGHPEPFGLKMIGVGNEQWDDVYFERYEIIHRAVKRVHPEIELIGCAGWRDDGWEIDKAREWMRRTDCKPDYSDEHYYKPTEWFLDNANRYADYDAALPRVFAGEYAAHSSPETGRRRNSMATAVAEAAFLTGVENASPNVAMSSYAPLLARRGANQWQPDMIWFDQRELVLTPNYHVQRMFAGARGDVLLSVQGAGEGLYVTASRRDADGAVIVKAVNPGSEPLDISLKLPMASGKAHIETLSGAPDAENTFEEPELLSPKASDMSFDGRLKLNIAAGSVNVIVVGA